MSLFEIITLSLFYIMLASEILLLIRFKINLKFLDKNSYFVFAYLLSSIILATGSIICRYLYQNNMWLFSIIHYLQFLFLSLFYINVIQNNLIKISIKILLNIVLIVGLADFFIIEGTHFFNSISASIYNFSLIVYGIFYSLQLLKDKQLIENSIYITTLSSFWFNAGIFIYSCTSFMFCLSTNYIQGASVLEQEQFLIVLGFNYLAGIIQIILFYIGLNKLNYNYLK